MRTTSIRSSNLLAHAERTEAQMHGKDKDCDLLLIDHC